MLNDLCWTNKTLPIESFDVKLVTRAAAQFFDSVVEEAVSDVYRFPFSIFRFVMYSKTMNRGFLLFFQFQFDDDRIGCGSRQRYFWREWGSYSNRSYQNKFDWIDFFFFNSKSDLELWAGDWLCPVRIYFRRCKCTRRRPHELLREWAAILPASNARARRQRKECL